jgi:hypothetical protein
MADIRGVPAKVIRSEEQVVELLQHAADQQQNAQLANAFPKLAGGVKDLALASQAAGQGGAQPGQPAVQQGA